jgi:TPR repeat protein
MQQDINWTVKAIDFAIGLFLIILIAYAIFTYIKRRQRTKTLASWLVEAEKGNLKAQIELADYYRDHNDSSQYKWYEKAAEQGSVKGQVLAAYYCDHELKEPYETFKWARLAAEQGDPEGQVILGQCYAKGIGVEKNKLEADKLYKQALRHCKPGQRKFIRRLISQLDK